MTEERDNHVQSELSARSRQRIAVIAVIGGAVFFASYLSLLMYWSWKHDSWMLAILRDHFAATVGGPCAAFAAGLVVLVLRYTGGPMEIKGLGFEFKGASGQIVLWIFCFLAITSAIRILW